MTEAVGSLGEEAAKLIDAFGDWARAHSPGHADPAVECRICPLCQLLSFARSTRPETIEHLVEAANALTAAVRSLTAPSPSASERPSGVEHITVDEP